MPAAPERSRGRAAPDCPGVQLHVVTGKGGTGKSTVAAALALALASRGKTVLLCEVEGRQGIAQLFDVPRCPTRSGWSRAEPPDGSGDVYALAIDAESALLEYLDMYYRLGRAGKALDRFGVIEFATTIAPGVRDVLLTGKVYEAANRNRRNKGARDVRRDRAGRAADRPDRAVPQRQRRARRAGQGGADQVAGRHRDDPAPLRAYGDPPGHRARGDARAGDRATGSPSCAGPACRSAG